jgi:Putative metal-binding motif
MSVRRRWVASRGFLVALFLGSLQFACGSSGTPDPDGGGGGEGGSKPDDRPPVVIRCREDEDCDDGLPCNGLETCEANICQAGEPVRCNDQIACTRDYCEATSGDCVHAPPDLDGDGVFDARCKDQDGEAYGDDCDDDDPFRFPGNTEVCSVADPTHDEDCDASTVGELDRDRDNYTDRMCKNVDSKGKVFEGEDCDDDDRSVNPDTSEVCDGFDNNCNGVVDEGLLIAGYQDIDGDGFGREVEPGDARPGEIVGEDNKVYVCPGTPGVTPRAIDCNEEDPLVRPDMPELCDDVDNNCDESDDDNPVEAVWYIDQDGDGFGNPGGPVKISCAREVGYSLYALDCNDLDAGVNPNQVEVCDGKDNDCDGTPDFYVSAGNTEDDDQDGFADPACGTLAPDCDDNDPLTNPQAPELCDGKDNDCNGAPDTATQSLLWYIDKDGDGWGNPLATPVDSCDKVDGRVPKVGDCDDRDPTRNPGKRDDCTGVAGSDDNCDGDVDEDEAAAAFFRDRDGDGFGDKAGDPVFACLEPAGWAPIASDCDDDDETISPENAEVCDFGDGLDDDCDGAIDCADTDCFEDEGCAGLFQVSLTSPSSPVSALVATPFVAEFEVKSPTDVVVPNYQLAIQCKDGAYSPVTTGTTDDSGKVSFTVYPGLALGTYECVLTGATTVPFLLQMQAVAPAPGTVQPVVNLTRTYSNVNPTGLPGYAANIYTADAIDVDTDGTLYVAQYNSGRVYKVSPRGMVTEILGEINATAYPGDIALDRKNHILYILDVSATVLSAYDIEKKTLNRVAGGGTNTTFTEGMGARDFKFASPHHISVHPDVGVVVADSTNTKFVVLKSDGTLSSYTLGCPDKPCLSSCSATSCLVALSSNGSLINTAYYSTELSSSLLTMTRTTRGSTLPTQLSFASGSGAELPLSALNLGAPESLACDPNENLLLVQDSRVRWIGKKDLIARDLIGGTTPGTTGDYGPATNALVQIPADAAMDGFGNVWILENASAGSVRRIWKPALPTQSNPTMSVTSTPPTAMVGHLASPVQVQVQNSGGPLVGASVFFTTSGIPLETQGPAFTGSAGAATQTLWSSMVAGEYTGEARVLDLSGTATATQNYKMTVTKPPVGTITSIANVNRVYSGSGLWINSNFAPKVAGYTPLGVEVATNGDIYFVSYTRLYRLSPSGALRAIAGGGSLPPDNVPGLSANLGQPNVITLDEENDRIFVVRSGSPYLVLEVDLETGAVSTLGGLGASNPENGPAKEWNFAQIFGLAVNTSGTKLYLQTNNNLYEVDLEPTLPTVRTLMTAVTGAANCTRNALYTSGSSVALTPGPDDTLYGIGPICDGITATSTGFYLYAIDPSASPGSQLTPLSQVSNSFSYGGIDTDSLGRVYFANYYGHSVYRWASGSGLTLIAGNGTAGGSGDLGPAIEAQLNYPGAVAVTPEGDVIVVDGSSYAIRKVWLH